jgi:imidazolonepropionase-like amidohydrolase
MSRNLNPYKDGKLGVIEKGAYAHLLIYDRNPLEDIEIIVNYKENLKLIVKNGKVFKNDLQK